MKDHHKTKQQLINEMDELRKCMTERESKEPLELIIDKIPDLLAYINSDQYYIYVNRAYASWFGLSKNDIVGKKVKEILNEELFKEVQKYIRSVLRGKEITFEAALSSINGQLRYVKASYIPHFDTHGEVIAFLAMIEDVTEKERTEKALKESEKRYRALFERAADSIVLINPETGEMVEFNDRACSSLGYTSEEFKKIRISDFEMIESDEKLMKHFKEVVRVGSDTFETKHRTKSGEIRNILINSSTIDVGGKCIIQGIWRDITERKKAENALIYRSRFEKLITSISTYLASLSHDQIDGGINGALQQIGVFANVDRSYVFLFRDDGATMDNTHEWCAKGVKPQVDRLKSISVDIFHWSINQIKKSKTVYVPDVADLSPEAGPEKKEFQKEGIQSLIMVPMIYAGQVIGFLGFDSVWEKKCWPEDIILLLRTVGELVANTLDRKRAEEVLRESEKKFRQLVELLPQIIFEIDLEGNITFVNQYGLKMFGYTKKDFKQGVHLKQLFPPDEFRRAVENMQKILKGEEKPGNEYTAIKKDGSLLNVIAFSTPIFVREKHIGWRGTVIDVTEWKQAEIKLQESEEKFRTLAEQSPNMIFINRVGKVVYVNKKCKEVIGYTREELLSPDFNFITLIAPEYKDLIRENYKKQIKGQDVEPYEYVMITKKGRRVDTIIATKLIDYEDGKAILGIVTDISKRKRVVEKLRESEEQFSLFMDHLPAVAFIKDEDSKALYVNKYMKEVLGAKDWIKKPLDEILPRDLAKKMIIGDRQALNKGLKLQEEVVPGKDGIYRVFQTRKFRIDRKGKPPLLGGISLDITNQKQAEAALRESQERLELTLNSIGIGLWDHDMRTDRVIRSRHWAEMLGYKPKEIEENLEIWKKLIYPEDLPLVNKASKKHEAGAIPFFKVEHRLKTKKGDYKWVLNWGKIVERDKNGRPLRALGTHIDITDRKQAQAAIEKANQEWQNIFQAVGHPIIILDSRHMLIAANQAVLKKTGKSEKDLLGKKCFEIFHEKDYVPDGCPLEKMIKSGHIETIEMEMEALQGIYLVSCTPVLDENGKIEKIIHIATEITKRKKAEEALQESEERFRSIFENAVMGLYRTTPEGQITMANPALIRMLGYSTFEDLAQRNLEELGYEPEYPRAEFKERIVKEGKIIGLESAWIRHDRTTLYVSESARAIRDEEGNIRYYEGTVEDITERKKAEERIRQSLEEKEILLKEIHHRVKNNLQVIISLLNLQSAQIQDQTALKAFRNSNRRIRSMAMVHEKLYQSENFSTINFKEYIENMIQELFDAYRVGEKVELMQNIENIPLGISEAIPCGLIFNELVSNALKHAFRKDQEGQIQVVFHQLEGGEYELMVKDNGMGIPESVNFNETKSLGLLLVRILSNQLSGKIKLSREGGTVFKIRFLKP